MLAFKFILNIAKKEKRFKKKIINKKIITILVKKLKTFRKDSVLILNVTCFRKEFKITYHNYQVINVILFFKR